MSNAVLILTHNNLEYTKRCVESVQAQDISTTICGIDNGSTDGTDEWLREHGFRWFGFNHNAGVSKGWNAGLEWLFNAMSSREHVLVVGNDTVLAPWTYRELLSYNLPFVSGVAVDTMEQIATLPPRTEPVPHPDFSLFLIRKECWNKVGPFDESMVSWCSDCDFHTRAHRLGIPLMKTSTPFFHIRSRTIELAPPKEKRALELQADVDRMTFAERWKAEVGSPQYADLFAAEAFGVDLD